ncbi:beta-ketoacyl-ACP synthase III [Endozoicomonas sp. SM1973]|uniref:Beta-ketoacyl-ACP synthase III n=1 Tax=Spartinivicinus marinus TaxID=2994442 RepID=A0A853I1Z8_9GAMM|nr:beta-ketoacyl-ACP synthase III [Spartinivicinus marinus]MCX4029998.1 beta-ketoacyl-ACP synthase III [Spartinivicinus marinus]NYZ64758.1 beta-ketoacyl-ACP synthase III [Spartinivicinus marinus]
MTDVLITGTGLYTPTEGVSNEELVASFNAYVAAYNQAHQVQIKAGELEPLLESSAEFIEKASGIKHRYVMNKAGVLDVDRMYPRLPERSNDEPSIQCEMGIAAAKQALEQAGKTAADVDAIIVACSNMQRAYPAMAVEIQHYLDAGGFAYDMNVACSSATFGIQAGYNAITAGSAKTVLVISPEICSGHLNFRDRDSHFIFGDACTAVLLEQASNSHKQAESFKVLGTKLATQFSNNIRNNFGFLNRCDEAGEGKSDKLFVQNGRKVFKEVCPMVAEHISHHLETLTLDAQQLKRLWLHQANLGMNHLVAKKVLGREPLAEEAPVILDQYANTSSAGSIIAFHQHSRDLQIGDLGVICSFGAGYSVGSIVVEKC